MSFCCRKSSCTLSLSVGFVLWLPNAYKTLICLHGGRKAPLFLNRNNLTHSRIKHSFFIQAWFFHFLISSCLLSNEISCNVRSFAHCGPHSFTQQTSIEYLLRARLCARHWGCSGEQDRSGLCPGAAYSLVLWLGSWMLELGCLGLHPSLITTQLCGLGQVT